jgi:ABC-type antimicrobial peptide transport system permease subunit
MVVTLLSIAAIVIAVLFAVGKVPFGYTLRNLTVRWQTTLLTALAFTLVIALLTVMLAFVNGMQKLTEGTGQPGNVLILADGASDEVMSNLTSTELSDIENEPAVLRENGEPLATRETYLVVNQPIPNAGPGKPKRRFLQMRGLDDPVRAALVHGLELQEGGQWFSEAGVRKLTGELREAAGQDTAIEAVLGEGVARELARDRTPEQLAVAKNRRQLDVGDLFTLGDRAWIVSGIMSASGSTFNSEVWARRQLIGPLFGKENYTSMIVRTADDEAAAAFCDFLKEKYSKAAVAARVETEYYASLSDTNKQFLFAIIFVTVVMSIGGVLGVMNTMFAAVSQRIKDIGVLRLLGYSRRHIVVALLLESLLISLVGGLLGCLLGSFSDGWSATSIVAGAGMGKSVALKLVVDAKTLATGVVLTLIMGGLGGAVPALSAMRLTPLEALR